MLGGKATPAQISSIAKKYGRNPSTTAGYYSGKSPSLEIYEGSRYLTDQGRAVVLQARSQWGDNWLQNIPHEIVANPDCHAIDVIIIKE